MIDKKMFRSKMALKGDTLQTLSKAIGISRLTLFKKVNGQTEFNRKEIAAISGRYKLDSSEVIKIFGLSNK